MRNFPWLLGIDLGTGSCKSVAVDEHGRVIGFATGEYSGTATQERWQEQAPEDLWRAAVASVRAAVTQAEVDPRACGGLSIGGALHSLLALDRHGEPLTGVITWADGRAGEQAVAVSRKPLAEQLYQLTGCPVHGMYPLYKIIWLAEKKPEVFGAAWRYVTAKEYLFSRLTGEYMVDYCLAAGSGLLNTYSLAWDPLCLETAGIGSGQLSEPCSPLTVIRGLDPDAARQMGLPIGIPVVLGSADAANSNLGAGALQPWQATCMVGTSGAFRVIYPRPVIDPERRTWCYVVDPGHWLVGGAINNGGVALSWLRDCLNQALAGSSSRTPLSFDHLLDLASRAPAGAGGIICLPFFAGERSPNWNLNARGAFFGLNLSHGAAHLCRALVEAIALRFKNLSAILAEVGVDTRQVIASGGFTRSDFWLQVVTDALDCEMVVPEWGETSSLGAAFWAMLGTGRVTRFENLKDFVPLGRTCRPDAASAAVYNRIYPLYLKLYQAVQESFDTVALLQKGLHNDNASP
jgi:gluconokinase